MKVTNGSDLLKLAATELRAGETSPRWALHPGGVLKQPAVVRPGTAVKQQPTGITGCRS